MYTGSKLSKFQINMIRLCSTVALTAVIFCFGLGPGHSAEYDKGHVMAGSSLPITANEKPEPQIANRFTNRLNHNIDLADNKKQKNYHNLSPEEKKEIEKKYKEWQRLSPQEKKKIRQRMNKWKKMTPEEKELYRRRYKQLQHLSPEERQQLQRDLERWNELTPQQKEAIRKKFSL